VIEEDPMGAYTPPVSSLLTLGYPHDLPAPVDYTALGIGPEHVPDLLRVLNDQELLESEPECYARIYAWRALGQLRAPEAVEPLLALMATQEGEDWDDWLTEEVPGVLGLYGPGIIPAVVARLEQRGAAEWPPVYFAMALTAIAKHHPEARVEVIDQLCRVLDTAPVNSPVANAGIISDLIDLKAVEAWPVIERAYATGNVDEMVNGDVAHAKHYLGLGPKPPLPLDSTVRQHAPTGGSNAKQRFNERQRKKKLEKKNKKKRRG
jgi:hypothetical protein